MIIKVYVHGYFRKNVGDDLFLKVLTKRYPAITFYANIQPQFSDVFSDLTNLVIHDQNDFQDFKMKAVSFLTHGAMIDSLIKYDAIIELGGSIFMQNGVKSRVSRLHAAFANKKIPYFIIGSNFGPYFDDDYLTNHDRLFAKTDGVVFRDSYSGQLFKSNHKVLVEPDVIFNLGKRDHLKSNHGISTIAFSLVDFWKLSERDKKWLNRSEYIIQLSNVISNYVDQGYECKLLSFCEFEGDLKLNHDIVSGLSEYSRQHVQIIEYSSSSEIIHEMQTADYLVSSRFHSMILGWLIGIPQLIVSYSRKTMNVVADIFPQQKTCNLEEFLENKICLQDFNRLPERQLDEAIAESSKQFQYFDAFLREYKVEHHN
ncbi:polysaccharide pyruvyl transferase family protein [Lacticaseibacillus suilingensis]|uniref:Polysaccharide pyruvyl transferase family protein n=1 Tax=Lacticaseibacillus suilingensis TaxID=2799577 RepID=A0ABW4BH83_9LACO|nr:polysaccharide pyruvyl transferase family protein [Lacticaseibacillus suilingensis]